MAAEIEPYIAQLTLISCPLMEAYAGVAALYEKGLL